MKNLSSPPHRGSSAFAHPAAAPEQRGAAMPGDSPATHVYEAQPRPIRSAAPHPRGGAEEGPKLRHHARDPHTGPHHAHFAGAKHLAPVGDSQRDPGSFTGFMLNLRMAHIFMACPCKTRQRGRRPSVLALCPRPEGTVRPRLPRLRRALHPGRCAASMARLCAAYVAGAPRDTPIS